MDVCDFAAKFRRWTSQGFKELGDYGGMGIGRTTHSVLCHNLFDTNPHQVRKIVQVLEGIYFFSNSPHHKNRHTRLRCGSSRHKANSQFNDITLFDTLKNLKCPHKYIDHNDSLSLTCILLC